MSICRQLCLSFFPKSRHIKTTDLVLVHWFIHNISQKKCKVHIIENISPLPNITKSYAILLSLTGPMVWYQDFEYAIGHWFQKATEHVFGCVLCSPGCFSLFRGSALLDDNVMRKYAILPTEASHYLQYDQGEDRWLCTLLLQQVTLT